MPATPVRLIPGMVGDTVGEVLGLEVGVPVVGPLVGVALVGDAVGELIGLAAGRHEAPVGSCFERQNPPKKQACRDSGSCSGDPAWFPVLVGHRPFVSVNFEG